MFRNESFVGTYKSVNNRNFKCFSTQIESSKICITFPNDRSADLILDRPQTAKMIHK